MMLLNIRPLWKTNKGQSLQQGYFQTIHNANDNPWDTKHINTQTFSTTYKKHALKNASSITSVTFSAERFFFYVEEDTNLVDQNWGTFESKSKNTPGRLFLCTKSYTCQNVLPLVARQGLHVSVTSPINYTWKTQEPPVLMGVSQNDAQMGLFQSPNWQNSSLTQVSNHLQSYCTVVSLNSLWVRVSQLAWKD